MSGKISILFPCYNQRDFIAQGIKSCFDQDYENIEVVVLDDGSNDDSLQVISDIAKTAPVPVKFSTQKNHGPSYTYRKLAETASGDYLIFLGGDDFLPPNCLRKRLEILERNQELMFVCGMGQTFKDGKFDRHNFLDDKALQLNDRTPQEIFTMMKRYRPQEDGGLMFQAALFRKSDYLACGGFTEGMICDDTVLFYNLNKYACETGRRFKVIPDIAVCYRLHDDNISKDPEKMWIRFSELHNVLGFQSRRQASFSAYATYMTAVRKSGKWYHKDILKRIFSDRAVIKYLTLGAIGCDFLFPWRRKRWDSVKK